MIKYRLLFFLLLGMLMATEINASVEEEDSVVYLGIHKSLYANHHHMVYSKQEDHEMGSEEPNASFNEHCLQLTLYIKKVKYTNRSNTAFVEKLLEFFKKDVEINLYLNSLKTRNANIAGGVWSFDKTMLGISAGKVIPLHLNKNRSIAVDFSGGVCLDLHANSHFQFIKGKPDSNVEKSIRLGTALYSGIRLRVKLSILKQLSPMVTVGFKWYMPFNDFQYNRETNASYRLQRRFLTLGLYFNIMKKKKCLCKERKF